jgi:hypothetical protein
VRSQVGFWNSWFVLDLVFFALHLDAWDFFGCRYIFGIWDALSETGFAGLLKLFRVAFWRVYREYKLFWSIENSLLFSA